MSIRAFGISLLYAAAAFAQQGAEVAGNVRDTNGSAIEGVTVTLTASSPAVKYSRSTLTGPGGAFRIETPGPGEYLLEFEKRGYLPPRPQTPGAEPVSIGSGQRSVHIDVSLPRVGRVEGKVADRNGKPLGGLRVELQRVPAPGIIVTRTDADGRFLFDQVMPGKYMLLARPAAASGPVSAAGSGLTYYPGVTEPELAQVIVAEPDSALSNTVWNLRSVDTYALSGRVLIGSADPVGGAQIQLAPERGLPELSTVSASDGTFTIPNARQGNWRLFASAKVGGQDLVASELVKISGPKTGELTIRLSRPVRVTAEVQYDKPPAPGMQRQPVVLTLVPVDGAEAALVVSEADGRLTIPAVRPSRYWIVPSASVPGYYLGSVTAGGPDMLGQPVEIQGEMSIQLHYRSGPGRLRGRTDSRREINIAVVPLDPRFNDHRYVRLLIINKGGEFQATDLAPGEYAVSAISGAAPTLHNPLILEQLRSSGTRVLVEAGREQWVEISGR